MTKKLILALIVYVLFLSICAIAQEGKDTLKEGASPSHGVGIKEFTSTNDIIKTIVERAEGIKDYTLSLYYSGKEGTYIFDYRCVRPNKIRTRIVEGQNARAILLYLPEEKEDQIKAKKGMFRKWISIDKYKETPLIESMLDYFIREIQKYPEGRIVGKDKVILTFGKMVAVTSENNTVFSSGYVSERPASSPTSEIFDSPSATPTPESSASPLASGDPSQTLPSPSQTAEESPDPTPERSNSVTTREKIVKECYIIEFTKDNIRDIIAIDTETLWVVFRKKLVDGKVDQEAALWDIKENSNPEIKF